MLHLSAGRLFSGARIPAAPVSTTADRIRRHRVLGKALFLRDYGDDAETARIRREREGILRSFKSDPPQTPPEAAALIRYVLTLCRGFELTIAERDCLKAAAKALDDMSTTEGK